jgi:hypothetical protein
MQAAGRRALAAVEEWDLESFHTELLRTNIAEGLLVHGWVGSAAEHVDPFIEQDLRVDHWAVNLARVGLDVVRGHLADALERAQQLDDLSLPDFVGDVEFHDKQAWAELWSGHPGAALDRLTGLLNTVADTKQARFSGACLALAARGAADLATTTRAGPGRRQQLADQLEQLLAGMKVDPFAARSLPANGVASGASWRAELTRLAGTPAVEPWTRAAREWARLGRPFDAAYCRWRGAQAALATGQGNLARRLLDKAAAEAHEHVPLYEAIRATQGLPDT